MLRTFFAVKIDPTPGLRRLHARLSALGDRFRPVALDNLHVTLKFLGDISESQVPEICSVSKRVVDGRAAIHVRLSGLGAFPGARRPSVVWVGLAGAETLHEIAADLDRALSPLGFVPEARSFQPHLTLLRVKSRPPEELFSLLAEESGADFGMVPIEAIEFLQSELTPRGSRYTKLATFALAPHP
jgi:RNA 2',3'-cyclic 3'-phosphodiesterase